MQGGSLKVTAARDGGRIERMKRCGVAKSIETSAESTDSRPENMIAPQVFAQAYKEKPAVAWQMSSKLLDREKRSD